MPNIAGGLAQGFAIGQAAGGRFSPLGDALSQFVQQAFQEGGAQRQFARARGERIAGQEFQRGMMGEEQTFRTGERIAGETFTAKQAMAAEKAAWERAILGAGYFPKGTLGGYEPGVGLQAKLATAQGKTNIDKLRIKKLELENRGKEFDILMKEKGIPDQDDLIRYERELQDYKTELSNTKAQIEAIRGDMANRGENDPELPSLTREWMGRKDLVEDLEKTIDSTETRLVKLWKLFSKTPAGAALEGPAGATEVGGAGVGGAGVAPGTTIQPSPFLEAAEAEMGLR